MVERIYDTIKGILWTEFPKNHEGIPQIYDRTVKEWMFGDRKILPTDLGIILRGTQSDINDIGYGLREITYTIKLTIYSSADDTETSERVIQEAARIAHTALKKHRTMWICELCPFCGLYPLSPIHYIDNGVITDVGITTATIPSGQDSYKIHIYGSNVGMAGTAYVRLSQGISGKVTVAEILSSGIGITMATYSDSNATLSFTLSNGSGHVGASTSVLYSYAQNVVDQINTFWAETHTSPAPEYLDWSGVAYEAVQQLISDWTAGFKNSQLSANSKWDTNLDTVVSNKVDLMRLLQDIQISSVTPSDDGVDQAFLHSAEFIFKAKELISVENFGPNNVDVNAI
jgi:hypothetical protein